MQAYEYLCMRRPAHLRARPKYYTTPRPHLSIANLVKIEKNFCSQNITIIKL